ncbi:MAG: GAF domain-containing sensor histidine kinase [Haloferacaceae archaeon]
MTDQDAYEARIEGLHQAMRQLVTADTKQEVAERTTEAVHKILGYPNNVVRLLDEEDQKLHPVAISEGLKDELSLDRPAYEIGQPTAGAAFEKGETIVYDDLRELDDDITHTPGESMYVPLGEQGVLTVSATETDAFDETDIHLAEMLAANAEVALDRVAQTQALRKRNEHLEEVVDLVAHDLRNPLEVAVGRLELAQETGELTHLDAVEHAHERIDELIDDLLTFAQEGERVSDLEAVPLGATIEDCWQTIASETATLTIETDQLIYADRQRLQRLLENLLENAVRHGSEDVRIRIGELDDGFYVADDGPGIPEEKRDHVLKSGYSTESEGTGFGLAIVNQVVEAHEWDIRVTESATGGARFEIIGVRVAAE